MEKKLFLEAVWILLVTILLVIMLLLRKCSRNVHCDSSFTTSIPCLSIWSTYHRVCCLWRVMAAFVANVSELPFTHLHITCPIPRKPIISTCAGTGARVSAKETCLFCRARRRKSLRLNWRRTCEPTPEWAQRNESSTLDENIKQLNHQATVEETAARWFLFSLLDYKKKCFVLLDEII